MAGYVSSFTLPPPDWLYKAEPESTQALSKFVQDEPDGIQTSEALEAEANRKTGDMTIYLYYARSIGWLTTLIFVFFMCGFVFCVSFPSKPSSPLLPLFTTANAVSQSYLGQMVGEC